MSSYDQGPKFPQLGPMPGNNEYLAAEARIWLKQLFRFPEDLPQEFWSAVEERVNSNAHITRSQVEGLTQFTPRVATPIATSQSTTSTSFVNLATVGPQLTELSDGQYLEIHGALIGNASAAGEFGGMGVSVNDAAVLDASTAFWQGGGGERAHVSIATIQYLRNGGSNSIVAKYRSNAGNSVSFERRWLIALKVGN